MNVPHNERSCMCPACILKRDSKAPTLKCVSYRTSGTEVIAQSVERDVHGNWSVNARSTPLLGHRGEQRDFTWSVSMWNEQARKRKERR